MKGNAMSKGYVLHFNDDIRWRTWKINHCVDEGVHVCDSDWLVPEKVIVQLDAISSSSNLRKQSVEYVIYIMSFEFWPFQ